MGEVLHVVTHHSRTYASGSRVLLVMARGEREACEQAETILGVVDYGRCCERIEVYPVQIPAGYELNPAGTAEALDAWRRGEFGS